MSTSNSTQQDLAMGVDEPTVDHTNKAIQLSRSNIPSLVCAFSASCTTGGAIYAFGIYGDALKNSLQLTQLQLNSLSATFFVAGLLTWIPGMVVDQKGTRFSFVTGGCLGATFMLTYWALARQFLVLPQYLILPVLYCLSVCICLSCGLIIGSIFKLTTLCGGEGTRGSAVGVAKGFVGLGAGLYACIFSALKTSHQSPLDFLPVIATFFVVCAAAPAYFLLPDHHVAVQQFVVSETTPLHFRVMYTSLFLLGIVIVGSSILDLMVHHEKIDASSGESETRNYGKVILILVLWLGPIASLLLLPRAKPKSDPEETTIAVVVDDDNNDDEEETQEAVSMDDNWSTADNPSETTQLLASPILTPKYQRKVPPRIPLNHKQDLNLGQMLQQPSAWLMLWTAAILVGSGTYKTNNMGEMVSALGFPQADMVVPATLAIFSVSQMTARVLTGVISEATLRKIPQDSRGENKDADTYCLGMGGATGIPRPFYLVVASAIGALSHFLLAFATDQVSFVIYCTISGLAFGMAWPLMVLIIGEVFGTAHVGANYMFYDGFSKAVGTTFLSTYVAGTIYDANVDPEHPLECKGTHCFRATHLIVAVLCLSGVAASLALQYVTRGVYRMDKNHT